MQDDLREWLRKVDGIGKLRTLEGADWDLEIATASVLNMKREGCPALLFDSIKGYPKGYRVLTCTSAAASLVALLLNLPVTDSDFELLRIMREKLPQWDASVDKFVPEVVSTGPILENIDSGNDVDLFKFPVPRFYPLDGGRYIGTGHAVITTDPDTGEVNLGTYRLQVHDRRTTGWFMSPNQHGDMHRKKYHARGQRCPVAVSLGHHPLIFRVASVELPLGTEYQFAGAVRGEPVRVIKEEITGLPIPADSEIVLAGWCPPNVNRIEGPFGEWTGYYGGARAAPIIEVERVYYRNNPILMAQAHVRPSLSGGFDFRALFRSALLGNELIKAGIPGVNGVWLCRAGGPMLIIISLKQEYAGHARQAALLVSQSRMVARQGRYVIVVDEDIDPTDIGQVLWALCSRSDPETGIDIIRRLPSSSLDPVIRKPAEVFFRSGAIIDACKPYEWIGDFPKSLELVPEVAERVRRKWGGPGW